MPGGSFVTTGHTSGSDGAGTTACAVADGAPRLPALTVANAPPRNVRRFIMSGLPSRQGRQNFNNMAGASASRPLRVMASKAIERVDLSVRGADGETAQLLSRFEAALRAAARLLHDLVRVDRAPQLGDAFDAYPNQPMRTKTNANVLVFQRHFQDMTWSCARRTSRRRRLQSTSEAILRPRAHSSEDLTRAGASRTSKTASTILRPQLNSASFCNGPFPSPRPTARRGDCVPAACFDWRTPRPARDTSLSSATSLDSSCSFGECLLASAVRRRCGSSTAEV